MIEITIIIPVYNEIKTIENLLSKVIDLEIKKQIIVIMMDLLMERENIY